MEQVEEICDQIVLVNKGQKILDGSVTQIKEDFKEHLFKVGFEKESPSFETNSFDIISSKNNSSLVKIKDGYLPTDVLKEYLQKGAPIHSFNEVMPSLNDIFIRQVEGTKTAREFVRQS
jgi:ABC-2 type transport system ATP-binding protein